MREPPKGTTVAGKYLLGPQIGSGGFGSVYEAEHLELGKRVAIKVIDAAQSQNDEATVRFKREARAASAVASEHIVQIFDVGWDDQVGFYMVMELLEGEDVSKRLARSGPPGSRGRLPVDVAVTIGIQAARALAKAHAAGVVHRDLKPGNLFLTTREDGSMCVKILDFGISKLIASDAGDETAFTTAGTVIGTPMYMSPEQARGGKIDGRTDMWSLAAVLYQLLSGRAPYEGAESYTMLLAMIANERPRELAECAPWVPKKVADVVERLFVHDVDLRPSDAGAFAKELASALGDTQGSTGAQPDRTPGVYVAGDVVKGYQIIGRLRAGGMATLYVASRQGAAGFTRAVAIKVIHPHLAQDPDFVQMFVEEARLLANIVDPNVVHVEELIEDDGALLLVMEYVHGCSLAQLLIALAQTKRRFLPEVAAYIGIQVAAGLHAAHEARNQDGEPLGIVHRDISPQNVLVARQGHVKLIDFGVAKARSVGKSATGSLRGKVGYMSPEQAWGRAVDRRSDVYSLGVVLWELLTTRRLFTEKNELALLDRVRSPDIKPPEAFAQVPAPLSRVVMTALAPDPAQRPATANELRRMLIDAVPSVRSIEPATLSELVGLVLEEDSRLSSSLRDVLGPAAPPVAGALLRSLSGRERGLDTFSIVHTPAPKAIRNREPPFVAEVTPSGGPLRARPASVPPPTPLVIVKSPSTPPPPAPHEPLMIPRVPPMPLAPHAPANTSPSLNVQQRERTKMVVAFIGAAAIIGLLAFLVAFRTAAPSASQHASDAQASPPATIAPPVAQPSEPGTVLGASVPAEPAASDAPAGSVARTKPAARKPGTVGGPRHTSPKGSQPSVQIVDGVPIVDPR